MGCAHASRHALQHRDQADALDVAQSRHGRELEERRGEIDSRFLYEYFYETGFYVPNLVALQRGRYKLVRYLSNPSWTELFDLTRDPLEITNLATSPAAALTLGSMSTALDDALRGKKFKIPAYADPEP